MEFSSSRKRFSTSDVVYQEVKRGITELEYAPGVQVNEENFAAELQVSRTPLRQALYRLVLEGLLIRQSNGRIHVAPITVIEAEEIYKVREVLEGLMAREATECMQSFHLTQLEDALELMKRAAEQNRAQDTIRHGSNFHQILYSISDNQTAKQFLEQLNSRIERYRRIGGYKNPAYNPLVPTMEHEQILQLIRNKDAIEVEQAMRAHIRRSLEVAKETLQLYLQNDSEGK
jgi:DNA-binding GntR family transcriptional regulator